MPSVTQTSTCRQEENSWRHVSDLAWHMAFRLATQRKQRWRNYNPAGLVFWEVWLMEAGEEEKQMTKMKKSLAFSSPMIGYRNSSDQCHYVILLMHSTWNILGMCAVQQTRTSQRLCCLPKRVEGTTEIPGLKLSSLPWFVSGPSHPYNDQRVERGNLQVQVGT